MKNFRFTICLIILLTSLNAAFFSVRACAANINFTIFPPAYAIETGKSAEITIHAKIESPYHIYAPQDKTGVPLSFVLSGETLDSFKAIYPQHIKKNYPALGEELYLYENNVYSTLEISLKPGVNGKIKLELAIRYQACTETMCTPPVFETREIELNVSGQSETAAVKSSAQIETLAKTDSQEISASAAGKKSGFYYFYEKSFFMAIAVAFLWGVLSSLTPCVYPMIPITIAFFGSQSPDKSRSSTFKLALSFVFGIALSFAMLGVIVASAGIDPGSIMSNSYVGVTICALLILFAAAMFELFEIRIPGALMSKLGQSGPGYAGALTMGLTMGLVAAPCVGPFAGALLIFAAAINSLAIGFLMLFSYGLGLGMLFLAVAMGANFLPRSGMWMVRLKNFFGLLILWLSLYFMQFIASKPFMLSAASLYAIVSAAVLGAFSTVDENTDLIKHFTKGSGIISLVIASALALGALEGFGIISMPALNKMNALEKTSSAEDYRQNQWMTNYDAAMKKALDEKKPVIIDFYADWCLPCKQMEHDIFKNPDFIIQSERFVKVKLDCTNPSNPGAIIKKEKYHSPYMPYVIFYDSAHNKISKEIQGYTDLKEFLQIIKDIK